VVFFYTGILLCFVRKGLLGQIWGNPLKHPQGWFGGGSPKKTPMGGGNQPPKKNLRFVLVDSVGESVIGI